MSEPFVIEPDDREPLDLPYHDNMTARELVNPEHGSDNVVFRITEIEAGRKAVEDWHVHEEIDQLMFVLSGEGKVRMSEPWDEETETTHDMGPETFVYVPPGVYHNAWSTGDTPLRMIVIWAPPYDDYEDWNPDA